MSERSALCTLVAGRHYGRALDAPRPSVVFAIRAATLNRSKFKRWRLALMEIPRIRETQSSVSVLIGPERREASINDIDMQSVSEC